MVICCNKRSIRDSDVSFFSFPRIIENKGILMKEISERRQKEWISRINRADLSNSNIKHKKVWSEHFINGKPSDLMSERNPDWAPSLYLGHTKYKANTEQAKNRYKRASQRNMLASTSISSTSTCSIDPSPSLPDCSPMVDQISVSTSAAADLSNSTSVQTECTLSYIFKLETELNNLRRENAELKEMKKSMFFAETQNQSIVHFYTGLPTVEILNAIYNLISPRMQYKPISITLFQSFYIFLMRLRLNLLLQDLAYRFCISQPTVARIFDNWLEAADSTLSPTISWPERSVLRETMPTDFKMVFGSKIAVIVDCFEINIDRPTSLSARTATWSNYKHHNTLKVLLGISPQGAITFVSEGWCGRVSDKFITEHCGILEKLLPGDCVMADRGFNIGDAVGFYCAELIKPASAREKTQLSPNEINSKRKLASLRIHVERVIGNLRQKYTILKAQLPVECLTKREGEEYAPIDKIIKICCAFTNLSKSLIPLD